MAVEYSVGTKEPARASASELDLALSRSSGPEESATGLRPTANKIAILIPCYNEEQTVADVVTQFRAQLPTADIYVFDNNSSDRTVSMAQAAGARVFHEQRQGKGYVTQTMFRTVDADAYVIVDGDGTYPAPAVHRLLAPVLNGEADMVVGSRLHAESRSEFKQLNALGNRLVLGLLNAIFRVKLTDILSGYRSFNRKFVKSLPLFGGGFEIETELTIKAIERGFRIIEIPIDLTHRPEGSHSKIKFFRDGAIILNTLLALFRDYKPLTFFGSAGLLFLALALVPGLMVVVDFMQTGLVGRLSLAVLAVILAGCGLLSLTVGLILHSIARRAQEFEYQLQVIAEQFGLNSVALKSPTGSRDSGR